MPKIPKIGHRGAKGYAPENTIYGFEFALNRGVNGIELDVHLSSDGEIIVIHDETIDRTTNGKGYVNKLSLSQLKAFRIEGEYEIPTLREVFDLVNHRCLINIELKSYESVDKVVSLIEEYVSNKNWNFNQFLVSSFDWNAVQQVRFSNAEIPIGILTETDLNLAFSFAKFMKAEAIHPYFLLLTKENTTQIQVKGIQVFPWTVNTNEDIQKMQSFEVNGIITDFPDKI